MKRSLQVEQGDIISFRYGHERLIGMVADTGGAGGWRIVVLRGPRRGLIILGNDCDDARIELTHLEFQDTLDRLRWNNAFTRP